MSRKARLPRNGDLMTGIQRLEHDQRQPSTSPGSDWSTFSYCRTMTAQGATSVTLPRTRHVANVSGLSRSVTATCSSTTTAKKIEG